MPELAEVDVRNRSVNLAALLLAGVVGCVVACDGAGAPAPAPGSIPSPNAAPTIVVQGMTYVPLSLEVTPGAVVTVHNLDSTPHSVTSESAPGSYTPGAVNGVSFDTGPFDRTGIFLIPASAPVGTVIPYYCDVHLGTMVTPDGELRVVAAVGTAH